MDQNGQAAAQPASAPAQPAAQPAQTQFNVPQGYSLVAESDLQTLRRHEQSVRGFQPLYDRLSKSGIKSEKDWESFEPIVKTARERKIDARAFSSMFSAEADADLNGTEPKPQSIDIDGLKKQMLDEVRTEHFTLTHNEQRKNDSKVIEAAMSKVLGDDPADDYTKELVKRSVTNFLEDNRGTYPEDHPLASKFLAPLSQELADKAVAHFAALKAKQKGAEMADRATAANTVVKKTPTAAGGGSSASGKPQTIDETRPGGLPSRAAAEAAAERIKAARAVSGRRR